MDRRLRIETKTFVQTHASRANQLRRLRARAIAQLGEGASQADPPLGFLTWSHGNHRFMLTEVGTTKHVGLGLGPRISVLCPQTPLRFPRAEVFSRKIESCTIERHLVGCSSPNRLRSARGSPASSPLLENCGRRENAHP